jgi:hypothetical protein
MGFQTNMNLCTPKNIQKTTIKLPNTKVITHSFFFHYTWAQAGMMTNYPQLVSCSN